MMIIITYGPQMEMNTSRISIFLPLFYSFFYLAFDVAKILLAKQLKHRLTPVNIYKIKRVISVVILIFGLFFYSSRFLPKKEKEMITISYYLIVISE